MTMSSSSGSPPVAQFQRTRHLIRSGCPYLTRAADLMALQDCSRSSSNENESSSIITTNTTITNTRTSVSSSTPISQMRLRMGCEKDIGIGVREVGQEALERPDYRPASPSALPATCSLHSSTSFPSTDGAAPIPIIQINGLPWDGQIKPSPQPFPPIFSPPRSLLRTHLTVPSERGVVDDDDSDSSSFISLSDDCSTPISYPRQISTKQSVHLLDLAILFQLARPLLQWRFLAFYTIPGQHHRVLSLSTRISRASVAIDWTASAAALRSQTRRHIDQVSRKMGLLPALVVRHGLNVLSAVMMVSDDLGVEETQLALAVEAFAARESNVEAVTVRNLVLQKRWERLAEILMQDDDDDDNNNDDASVGSESLRSLLLCADWDESIFNAELTARKFAVSRYFQVLEHEEAYCGGLWCCLSGRKRRRRRKTSSGSRKVNWKLVQRLENELVGDFELVSQIAAVEECKNGQKLNNMVQGI